MEGRQMKKKMIIALMLVVSMVGAPVSGLSNVIYADGGESSNEILLVAEIEHTTQAAITIKAAIGELREYYAGKDKFTFRSALGYNHSSNDLRGDLSKISAKFSPNEAPKSASEHVGNIMGLVAAGQDPYDYNNKDYVKALVGAQNEAGKFVIGEYDDYPTPQAFTTLALDMVGAKYNQDKAVEALLAYQGVAGDFGGVDETGMVIGALGKNSDDPKVKAAINKGLAYLKSEQDEATGGFITWGAESGYSAAAVIQGLIAVGEDPLSPEWTKGKKTMVDSLLSFYKDGYFINESEYGTDIDSITEQGFIALADIYRGKSMFNEIKFNPNTPVRITIEKPSLSQITEGDIINLTAIAYDRNDQIVPVSQLTWSSSNEGVAQVDSKGKVEAKSPGTVTITAKLGESIIDSIEIEVLEMEFSIEYIGDSRAEKGKQVDTKIKVTNQTLHEKPATLIIGLFDKKDNKLVNYSIASRNLASKEVIELSAGFLVPTVGEHYIKAFAWDNLDKQNIMMRDPKEIQIAN